MIRIDKTGHTIPNLLTNNGEQKCNDHIAAYEVSPNGFELNTRKRTKFEFDSDIYGNDEIKSLLKIIQGHKCCFCEAKITHISHGDVEHFRPKAGYKQDENSQIKYPGYYWLAYEWNNLYLACDICNRSGKGNYFPLENPLNRSNPLYRDIQNEEPSFIDPCFDNPEEHIGFIGPDPIPINNSVRGKKTIKFLGLDREEIVEQRRTQLNRLQTIRKIVALTQDSVNKDQARQELLSNLRTAIQSDAEYSSMIKCNFEEYLEEL
ncbi:hypothetical protein ACFCT7_14420 [Fulvivirgaceae bacterium LMO-SS25]